LEKIRKDQTASELPQNRSAGGWHAWQNSNLRPFASEACRLLPFSTFFSHALHTFTSIQGSCFRSQSRTTFPRIHRFGTEFCYGLLTFQREKPPTRPPMPTAGWKSFFSSLQSALPERMRDSIAHFGHGRHRKFSNRVVRNYCGAQG